MPCFVYPRGIDSCLGSIVHEAIGCFLWRFEPEDRHPQHPESLIIPPGRGVSFRQSTLLLEPVIAILPLAFPGALSIF